MKGIKHVRHEVDFLFRKRKYMLFFINKDLLSKKYILPITLERVLSHSRIHLVHYACFFFF